MHLATEHSFDITAAPHAAVLSRTRFWHALTLATWFLYSIPQASAQEIASPPPVRYQAQYTQIYSDDVESVGPVLSSAFSLDTGGSITTKPTEVIDGQRSIKGVGVGAFTNFFRTNTTPLSFSPGRAYRVTFRYRILAALQDGMASFYSNAASAAHAPSAGGAAIKGNTGDSGTITMNGTLGPYSDYQVYWSIGSSGAVVIDDIQIEAATGNVVASENVEGSGPAPGSGLLLNGEGTVTTDPSLVIGGKASLHLTSGGGIVTNPAAVPLAGYGTYVLAFDYRVLQPGSNPETLYMNFLPAGVGYNRALVVNAYDPLLKNAPAVGRFAAGAQLGGASSYVFSLGGAPGADIVIDNLTVFRLDAVPSTTPPSTWARLSMLPYPRLGDEIQPPPGRMAYGVEGNALLYSWDTITRRLGLMDLITGVDMVTQTQFAGTLYRLRELNPNLVILPIHGAEGIAAEPPAPSGNNRDPEYEYMKGMASAWLLRDSKGNPVPDPDYPDILFGDITAYCPAVGGDTYKSYALSWLDNPVSTGVWDGFRFDNFFASIDFHILNRNDPALLDVDLNRNGIRDETTAMISEAYRNGATDLAQQFRAKYGDSQLAIANQGDYPDPSLAPYLNGYLFESFNWLWNNQSSGMWRMGLDMYRTIEATARSPHVNMIEGSGQQGDNGHSGGTFYTTPTADDLQQERFTLATALLGGAAYGYNLHGNLSAPLWYDEYAVDTSGVAVEDAKGKGYLGQALADGTELASPATLVWAEDFESGVLSPAFLVKPSGAVAVTQAPGEVIAGAGSLVVSNSDNTKSTFVDAETDPAAVPLTPGKSYLLTFDWRILETLDSPMEVDIFKYPGNRLDGYGPPTAIVAGDSGTAHIPFIVPLGPGPWTIRFAVPGGGGKIAFDNIRLTEGGIGPWRRDFENGFVLLNPLKQAYTFSADEVTGSLQRTGVHRILGTAAPDVNNGQPVSGSLTLAPFDAIVLLADHIDAAAAPSSAKPYIKPNGVISAAGFGAAPAAAPGSWIEIYGSNLSATTRSWTGSDFNGPNAPTSLDGVSVTIGGRAAYLAYVSPGQINALAPWNVPVGAVQVVVRGPKGTSDPYIVTVNSAVPGLLAPSSFQINGKLYAVAVAADGQTFILPSGALPGVPSRPAKPGETITLYGIGFGAVTPKLAAGTIVSQMNALVDTLSFHFANATATLHYHGLAPQALGLYQFNVVVPDVPDSDAVPITIELTRKLGSQVLYIAVQH